MKFSMKIFIAGTAFFSMCALSSSNAFAVCYDAGPCAVEVYNNATWWVMPGTELLDDEEYVPGYENLGPIICSPLGEPLGEGYIQTALPTEPCEIGAITPLLWNPWGKRQKQKVRKKGQCVPFTGTGEDALTTPNPNNWFADRGIGGCGWRFTGGSVPTTKRCGPTSAAPTCQE